MIMNQLMSKNKRKESSQFRKFGGRLLVIIGIAGIILPILPGWPFFFLGIIILGGDDQTRDRIIKRFPRLSRPYLIKIFNAVYKKNKI